MKTPYDAIVRLGQRSVDEVRLSISIELRQIADAVQARDALTAEVAQEMAAASADWQISTHSYLRDRARRNARLIQSQEAHEEALARLRDTATQAYGALHVAQQAQSRFSQQETARLDRLNQAELDDLAAARRFATRRARNRKHRS